MICHHLYPCPQYEMKKNVAKIQETTENYYWLCKLTIVTLDQNSTHNTLHLLPSRTKWKKFVKSQEKNNILDCPASWLLRPRTNRSLNLRPWILNNLDVFLKKKTESPKNRSSRRYIDKFAPSMEKNSQKPSESLQLDPQIRKISALLWDLENISIIWALYVRKICAPGLWILKIEITSAH